MTVLGNTPHDFELGQVVKAFHPRTLGVMHYGVVQLVGRTYVTVLFHVDQRAYKLLPIHIGLAEN